MKIDNIWQAFQKLEKISNSTEISDFAISQFNSYDSIEELQAITKELDYGEWIIFIEKSSQWRWEIIQSKLLENFIKLFFYKASYHKASYFKEINNKLDKSIYIFPHDFNEFSRSWIKERYKTKNIALFSMMELKTINDNNINTYKDKLENIYKNIKEFLYQNFWEAPILVNSAWLLKKPTSRKFIEIWDSLPWWKMINDNGLNSLSVMWFGKRLEFGESYGSIMRYIYWVWDYALIDENKNKLEIINQWSIPIVWNTCNSYFQFIIKDYLDITQNSNAFIDQYLHEKWRIIWNHMKLSSKYFDIMNNIIINKKPNLSDEIRLEILDYCRWHKDRLSYESTIKQSMEQLIQKMFEIKKNKL